MKIEVRDIVKSFKEKTLFDEFDLIVRDKDCLCLFGQKGVGKTTFLMMLGLIEAPDKGEILYNDNSVRNDKEKRKYLSKHIGFILEDLGLLSNDSIYKNMLVVSRFSKSSKESKSNILAEALEFVGLSGKENIKIKELTYFEKYLTMIAKMIVKDADVIFIDEPTLNLNPEETSTILDLISRLNKMNKTIVIASEDESVKRICNRIVSI